MPGKTSVVRVEDPIDRDAALNVLRATYQAEKGWVFRTLTADRDERLH